MVRRLKAVDEPMIGSVEVVHASADQGTVRPTIRRGLSPDMPDPAPSDPIRRASPQADVTFSDADLEEAAFRVLAAVLEQADGESLGDLRRLRGVGADAVDRQRRYFELKASARETPDRIELTANE